MPKSRAGGGLVHDDGRCVLRKGTGDQCELALPAADAGVFQIGQIRDAEQLQRGPSPVSIRRAGRREQAEMGRPSHQHHVEHPVGEYGHMGLRDVGHGARELLPCRGLDRLSGNRDRAGQGAQQAEQGLEQRGLAGAVGAEQTDHLSGADIDADVASDGPAGIPDGETAGLDEGCNARHDQPSRPRASSQRKNGAPSSAVRMPSGISMRAMVRASVSTSSK